MEQRDQRQLQGIAGAADRDASGHDIDQLPQPRHVDHDHAGAGGLVPAEPTRLVLLAGVVAPLVLFGALAAAVVLDGRIPGDVALQRVLAPIETLPLPSHTQDYFDRSPAVGMVLLAGLCLMLAVRGRLVEAVFAVVAVGGLLAVEPLLKDAFERPPPSDHASGWSFPSGTAMVTMAVACWALLAAWPRVRQRGRFAIGLAAPFVLAYGLAIVYLDWHYPSDVLAGWCLAVSWVASLWLGATALTRRRASRRRRVST
jgi:membrane-associated phospholipid phosphatase